jgi:predicted acylesterase/phospholipase RssA
VPSEGMSPSVNMLSIYLLDLGKKCDVPRHISLSAVACGYGMPIRYLVISGGGPSGFISYGVLKKLAKEGFWAAADIERIYGCSIGAMVGCLVALGYDWDWTDDYLIDRPWERELVLDERVLEVYSQQGIFGREFFEKALGPLLEVKGVSEDVTLAQFKEATGVSMHLTVVDLNAETGAALTSLSPESHADMSLLDAVWASCAYPFFFRPVHRDGACYVDGGLRCPYPLGQCLDDPLVDPNETLGIKNVWDGRTRIVAPRDSIGRLMRVLCQKLLISAEVGRSLEHQVEVSSVPPWDSPLDSAGSVLHSRKARAGLIARGERDAEAFLKEKSSQTGEAMQPAVSHQIQ